jgi:8-oxo-dGTP diphosphatase
MPANIHDFKNPASTASLIVEYQRKGLLGWFDKTFVNLNPKIYLVKRKHPPFEGMWALPGGFLNCDKESLETTAVRELGEETPFITKIEDLELLCVHSDPKRDPRGHVIDHVYIVQKYLEQPHGDGDYDDAAEGRFFPLKNLPELAFDHEKAIKKYMSRGYHYLDHKI